MQELLQCREGLKWIKYLTDKKFIMSKIKIKQVRSRIGRPKDQKRTLDALGLRKMNQIVEHNVTPQIEGMIKKINHLITIVE
jgi:large subunit ribosomal protein L30